MGTRNEGLRQKGGGQMKQCSGMKTAVGARRRISRSAWIAAAAFALLLLALLGLRLYAWTSRGQEARMMVLVNPWNRVDDAEYTPRLRRLPNGLQVDRGCFKALTQMLEDCRSAGFQPVVCSAYRSREMQQRLYDERVDELMAEGHSRRQAEEMAVKTVALPGTSEHELGLAVDLVDLDYQLLDLEQENTPTQRWLMENAWRYGFILRYPPGAEEITGYRYEPWHYRYVGAAPAEQIHLLGITLEEYLSMFFSDTAEIVFES